MTASIKEVTKFLKAFKKAAYESTITYCRNRKNLDVFTVLGMSQIHRTEYICPFTSQIIPSPIH